MEEERRWRGERRDEGEKVADSSLARKLNSLGIRPDGLSYPHSRHTPRGTGRDHIKVILVTDRGQVTDHPRSASYFPK